VSSWLCFDRTTLNTPSLFLAAHVLPMGHLGNACARQANLTVNWWDLRG